MGNERRGNHTVCNLSIHLVWVTKYRYPVLNDDLKVRCRDLLRQVCSVWLEICHTTEIQHLAPTIVGRMFADTGR